MSGDPKANNVTLFRARSFFGIVSVQHRDRDDPKRENITFNSGHIAHGRQYADPKRRNSPEVGYYGKNAGCGIALLYKVSQPRPCRIGIVGLGAGTIAAYARPGDYVRMYEINPQVVDIARRYFSFPRGLPGRSGRCRSGRRPAKARAGTESQRRQGK